MQLMRLLIKNIGQLIGIEEKGTWKSSFPKGKEMAGLGVIKDAWLAVEDGRIADFGSMTSFPGVTDWAGLELVDAENCVVLPTWADSHTHIVYAGNRQDEYVDRIKGLWYEEIAAKGGGIINSAMKLRDMSEEELWAQAQKRVEEVIQLGTGALEIKSGYGLDLDSELKILRVVKKLKETNDIPIKATLLAAHAVPPEFKGNTDAYIEYVIEEIIPAVAEENLADYIDIFCERNYFDASHTALIMEAGAEHGLKAKIHVNQFSSIGGVQEAVKHGALSVDHLEVMEEADYASLKGSDVIPVGLPACSLFLSIPYTPGRELIDSGTSFALATDFNPGSSPTGNMNLVVALACMKMKLLPEEAINAATIVGAAAMELQAELGSIAVGKRANLILTKEIPNFNYLPYAFGSNLIDRVFINGKSN